MTEDASKINGEDLRERYYETLKSYLARQRESDLEEAYSIGRSAEVMGLGVLDIANWHRLALLKAFKEEWASNGLVVVERASQVINECLAPFEMAYRGFWEANEKLQQANELLKMHTIELESSNVELLDVEKALESESERLSVTLQSIGDGVISTDITEKIILINGVAQQLTGWSKKEAIKRPVQDIFNVVDAKTHEKRKGPDQKAIHADKAVSYSNGTLLISKDGTERRIKDSSAPILNSKGEKIGTVLVFRDLTKEIKMEDDLAKVGRLESIGVLAGGLAHDLNNILTVIEGNLSLAKAREGGDHELVRLLEKAEEASERARELAKLLLVFSKGGEPIKKVVFIADLIRDTTKLGLSGSNVRPEFSIPSDLWSVEGDEEQLKQAVINLVVNARESMLGGGVLEVNAGNADVTDGSDPISHAPRIWISFTDHGSGISPENLPKIFDLYFTNQSKGRGLGLSIVSSIVDKHGGTISVRSVVDVGSTFTIELPASKKAPKAVVEAHIGSKSVSGKVMWMDDEDGIRELAELMLTSLGYEAVVAKDGEEVLALYRTALSEGHPFDAVILDLTIPGGMGGRETIKRLLEMDKGVKAIVCSGYSNDETVSQHKEHGFKGSLPKPFKMTDLERMLREIIE